MSFLEFFFLISRTIFVQSSMHKGKGETSEVYTVRSCQWSDPLLYAHMPALLSCSQTKTNLLIDLFNKYFGAVSCLFIQQVFAESLIAIYVASTVLGNEDTINDQAVQVPGLMGFTF